MSWSAIRVLLCAGLLPVAASAEDAVAVMRSSHDVSRVGDSVSQATYVLVARSGSRRERKTLSRTKLLPNGTDNMRLTRFLAPADVKGTAILLVEHSGGDDDMWIWPPALKKVRRLVSSNKRESFLGTDLSYGDVLGHRVEDWTHRIVREEEVDAAQCWVVESHPRTGAVRAESGYSKRLTWVRKDNFVAVRGEFWDDDDRLLKRTSARELKEIDPAGRRWQAMLLEATNVQTGHSTTVRVDDIRVNQGLRDDMFTTRALERE